MIGWYVIGMAAVPGAHPFQGFVRLLLANLARRIPRAAREVRYTGLPQRRHGMYVLPVRTFSSVYCQVRTDSQSLAVLALIVV